ncbi:MAG: type II toxin-antitoxin system VapC family toxin [Deltaproteobacteria bacterium]|nr:type II toxin-antitoxin system VapC family toxin [Deltaproteobacteria bacterium]MBW2218812.1 type II toxin-antitoxin system VapC family toxin [Deltaproteobacteria bacterium]
MRYFLDTNICIYYLKGIYPRLKEKLLSCKPDMIVIPAMTKAELYYGAEKSRKRKENLKRINEFLLPFQIQGFNDAETSIYATVRKKLEKNGNPIGPNDIIIASIVLANNGILVTNNTKEFNCVKGLKIENWTK